MAGFAVKGLLSASALSAAGSAADGARYFSSCGGADIPKEFDSHTRRAKVYLFTRPVDQFPDAEEDHLRHWSLVTHFVEDNSIRTADGNCDDNNRIRAYYIKEAPRHNGRYYLLGEIEISPQDLREKVVNNSCNGQPYTAALNNCQEWAKCLAQSLGSSIAEQLSDYKSLKEANPFAAVAGGMFSASSNTSTNFFNMFKSS